MSSAIQSALDTCYNLYHLDLSHFSKAQELTSRLAELHLRPREALVHPLVLEARNFEKSLLSCEKEWFENFSRTYLAARLGLSNPDVLEKKPSFATFAAKYRLYNYLALYDHTLKSDGDKLLILQYGEYTPWEKVQKVALCSLDGVGFAWKYGERGIQHRDMYQPLLTPSGHDTIPAKAAVNDKFRLLLSQCTVFRSYSLNESQTQWGGSWALQLCTCCDQRGPRFLGDHTWLRICTPWGAVYSFGLYRPDNKLQRACEMKKGIVASPDPSEFWNVEIQELTISVSSERAQEIVSKIIKAQKESVPFHIIKHNCAEWALFQIAGLSRKIFDATEDAGRLLLPTGVICWTDKFYALLPSQAQRVAKVASVFSINCLQYALRGDSLASEVADVKPNLTEWNDLLNPEKLKVQSPHTLAFKVFPAIKEWQNQAETNRWKLPKKV